MIAHKSPPELSAAASAVQLAQQIGPLPARPINLLEEILGLGWQQQQILDTLREESWNDLPGLQQQALALAASGIRLVVAFQRLEQTA